MKEFIHINADTIDKAISLLNMYKGKAKIIAGGTDLLGTLKGQIHPTYPEVIINIKTIPGLEYIKEEGGMLKIGALTKLYDIESNPIVKEKYPALAQAAHSVASPHIREMGTIGGNICQETRCWYYRIPNNRFYCVRKGGPVCYAMAGDNRYHSIFGGPLGCYAAHPSDTAPALMALNAAIVTNKRTIPIDNFFHDLKDTVLDPDEIVTEIRIPTPPAGTKQTYIKFRVRKSIDFPLVGVACVATIEGGRVSNARIALGAVAPKPIRATAAEDKLKGQTINEQVADSVAAEAVKNAIAMSKNKYKIQITKALVKRAILALV